MYSVFSFSEPGDRHRNEDAFEVGYHPSREDCFLCSLADGQGGQAGGARAAQMACRSVIEAAASWSPATIADSAAWMTILRRVDETVSADPESGYTTLIGFCVTGGNLHGASSGDSALLAIKAGGCEELTANQVKNPPIGSATAHLVPFATKLIRPWAVLAMSDGVWKYVGLDRVKEIGTRLRGQVLVNSLQEQARLLGSRRLQDDFTLVLIQDGDEDRAVPGLPPALN